MEQVQHMAQIYASASLETLVWLGDDVHSKCMDFFWGLSSSKYESSTTADMADKAINYELRRTFNNESLEPINAVLALPWFKRRWVIQEAALSEVHLYCRESDITWHAFSHALVLLSASSFDFDRPLIQQLKVIDNLAADSHDGWGILDCMVGFKNTMCSDSRDRIYSLLSLADDVYGPSIERKKNGPKKSEGRLRIAPDYGIDPGTVYRSFAEHLIQRQSHLDLLQCAGAFPATVESGFPSWIPEWTQEMRYTPFLDVPWFTAGPKKASKLEPKASTCYPWCFVNGVIVDSIAACSEESDASQIGRKDLSDFEVILENIPLFDRYRTGERLWQILALTLVADHALNHRLRTRVARPDSGWHDGRLMKKDARERDTQVLLDWFLTRDEETKEQFRNGSRVLHTFESPNVDDILQRCKDLSSTVHHTIVKSAYLKTEQSRNEWDETSSTSRSGWHSAIDPTDLPYMVSKMMKSVVKNSGGESLDDEGPSAEGTTPEKRAKDLKDIQALIRALPTSDDTIPDKKNDLDDPRAPNQPASDRGGSLSGTSASDSPPPDLGAGSRDKVESPLALETAHAKINSHEGEVEIEDKDVSIVESTEVGEDGKDGEDESTEDEETDDDEVDELPNATRSDRSQLDPEFMRRHPELMAEHVSTMTEMLALMTTGDTDGLVKFLETQLRKAQGGLKHYSTKIYGHATPEVLREHGLGGVADAIDEYNVHEQLHQEEQPGSDTSNESDFDDCEDEDRDYDDNDQDEEPAEPGEYARLAAIGDLRGDEDGFLWFPPDEQNTQIYTNLLHRTMEGRQLFFTESGYVGIAPTAAKVGDSVAVFRGGRTPFIIRQHDDSAAWRLVGDSYVHGLMRGEAFQGKMLRRGGL